MSYSIRHRRRHSLHQFAPASQEEDQDSDTVFIKVDLFISELERRLRWLEEYGNLKLDAALNRAYLTLSSIRQSCCQVSGELTGAGRRKARILVENVEARYHNALATKETLEAKAQAGMKLMEGFLADLETHAMSFTRADLKGMVDQGWRIAGDGMQRAREVVDEGRLKARRAKDTLAQSIELALLRAKETRLITYDELPHPWRINPYITRGYRFYENKYDCVKSIFIDFTNETVNIWSHLLGFILVLAVAFYFYPASVNFSLSSKWDVFIAALFFFGACKALICSTVYHTMNSISDQTLLDRFACVDYTGISMLIAASIMTGEYTAFYCQARTQTVYITVTAALGIGGIFLAWDPRFNRADMAWARVAFFVSLGATGFAPFVQLCMTRGLSWTLTFYAPIAKSIAVYLIGAIAYASKVPERWLHGWFDYCGGSHNLWHFAVLGGILYHYKAMQNFFSVAFQTREDECPGFGSPKIHSESFHLR